MRRKRGNGPTLFVPLCLARQLSWMLKSSFNSSTQRMKARGCKRKYLSKRQLNAQSDIQVLAYIDSRFSYMRDYFRTSRFTLTAWIYFLCPFFSVYFLSSIFLLFLFMSHFLPVQNSTSVLETLLYFQNSVQFRTLKTRIPNKALQKKAVCFPTSVCPSVRMKQFKNHQTHFHEITRIYWTSNKICKNSKSLIRIGQQ
jgi:hypothetical protein